VLFGETEIVRCIGGFTNVYFSDLNRLVSKVAIGALAAVSLVSGCGAARPDTVTLIVEDESPLNLTSSGFTIQLGDWQQEGITGGRYEIPLPEEWVTGTEVSISIVENLMAGFGEVGQDLYTGEPFDVWTKGTLTVDETGWDEPLTLHIGESVAYVDPGSWAKFKVSPQSGRLPFIRKAQSAANLVTTKLQELKRDWENRQDQGSWVYYYRCGLNFPWKLKSNGSWGGVSFNTIELYLVECSLNIETVYMSQARSLTKSVNSNEDYLAPYGKSLLVRSLESVSDALQDLANTYEREGLYLGSQTDFDKALVYIKTSNARVDEAIDTTLKLNYENFGKMSQDATALTQEWQKHCVKDGKSCK